MPISGDQYTDKNQRRFGLPMDSCVGDDGPSPTEVTTISKSGSKPAAAQMSAPKGGNPYAGN